MTSCRLDHAVIYVIVNTLMQKDSKALRLRKTMVLTVLKICNPDVTQNWLFVIYKLIHV